jgi:hypothetical protein
MFFCAELGEENTSFIAGEIVEKFYDSESFKQ